MVVLSMTNTKVIQTGLEMIDKYFCGSCKKELQTTDAMRICDVCLYGEKNAS